MPWFGKKTPGFSPEERGMIIMRALHKSEDGDKSPLRKLIACPSVQGWVPTVLKFPRCYRTLRPTALLGVSKELTLPVGGKKRARKNAERYLSSRTRISPRDEFA